MDIEANLKVEEIDLTELEGALGDYQTGDESLLIPLLQAAQKIYGYLPIPVLERISQHLRVPIPRVYGVVTFYTQFSLTPRGLNTIKSCCGTACHVRGGKSVLEALERTLGIKAGETTEDLKFTLETVACLGTCFLSPVIMINDKYFGGMTPKKVDMVLKQFQ
jgi:NADH:ubiquinone oxidoreductase subunit E